MAKNRSEESKYQSPTTGDYCTAAQYITELLLRREIGKQGEIPIYKFWNKEPWKKKFLIQVIRVNKKLKKYSAKAIINVIKNNKFIFSIGFPRFDELIEKEEEKIDNESKKVIEVKHTKDSKPMKSFGKENKRAKYKDL